MHPFDLRSAIMAKHAQHVVLIHFPIGLFMIAVLFDFIAQATGKAAISWAAYYNFLAAAISAPIALVTGILAWQLQLAGHRLHGILLLHLALGTLSALLICLVWWLHSQRAPSGRALAPFRLALELGAVGVVALTAHLGGFLSGVNLPG